MGTDVGEFLEGSVALSVTVTDAQGRVCATVAVHGPAPRVTLRKVIEFIPALRRAATAMGATLVAAAPAAAIEATEAPARAASPARAPAAKSAKPAKPAKKSTPAPTAKSARPARSAARA